LVINSLRHTPISTDGEILYKFFPFLVSFLEPKPVENWARKSVYLANLRLTSAPDACHKPGFSFDLSKTNPA